MHVEDSVSRLRPLAPLMPSAGPARSVRPACPVDETIELMRAMCFARGRSGLSEAVWEHLSSGGKRLRTRLAVLTVEALGGDTSRVVPWAAACEFLHNASLIHDDVQDGDRFRRGREAVWVRHGLPQAINAGDLCITLGYAAIGRVRVDDAVRWQLTQLLNLATERVVHGQSAEFALLVGPLPTFDDYQACVEGKTAALFSLPVEGAARIAGWSAARARALGEAFRPLGLLFQMQDDILDLYGDNGRDAPASDLRQDGKASALVVEYLDRRPKDAEWLLGLLHTPRAQVSDADVARATARFVDSGALSSVWRRIDEIRDGIRDNALLEEVRPLRTLACGFIDRALEPIAHTRPRLSSVVTG